VLVIDSPGNQASKERWPCWEVEGRGRLEQRGGVSLFIEHWPYMYVDVGETVGSGNIADRESFARTRPHASVEELLDIPPVPVHRVQLFNKKVRVPVCSRGLG
jgi:hypothetical protein